MGQHISEGTILHFLLFFILSFSEDPFCVTFPSIELTRVIQI